MIKTFTLVLAAIILASGCAARDEHVVHVIAEQASGLKKGAPVQYRGVDVGLVKQVYFTPAGVRIDLLIERDDVPMRARDSVFIKSRGAFGEQIVDIRPGDLSAPLLAHDATLSHAKRDSTVTLPAELWRTIVNALGARPDSTLLDSVVIVKRSGGLK